MTNESGLCTDAREVPGGFVGIVREVGGKVVFESAIVATLSAALGEAKHWVMEQLCQVDEELSAKALRRELAERQK